MKIGVRPMCFASNPPSQVGSDLFLTRLKNCRNLVGSMCRFLQLGSSEAQQATVAEQKYPLAALTIDLAVCVFGNSSSYPCNAHLHNCGGAEPPLAASLFTRLAN